MHLHCVGRSANNWATSSSFTRTGVPEIRRSKSSVIFHSEILKEELKNGEVETLGRFHYRYVMRKCQFDFLMKKCYN